MGSPLQIRCDGTVEGGGFAQKFPYSPRSLVHSKRAMNKSSNNAGSPSGGSPLQSPSKQLHFPENVVLGNGNNNSNLVAVNNNSCSSQCDQNIQEIKGSNESCFQVCVRIRPINSKEVQLIDPKKRVECVKAQDNMVCVLDQFDSDLKLNTGVISNCSNFTNLNNKCFIFDYVFSQIDSTKAVYQQSIQAILDNLVSGFNSTIFAYGQTGAGKTYTMFGDEFQNSDNSDLDLIHNPLKVATTASSNPTASLQNSNLIEDPTFVGIGGNSCNNPNCHSEPGIIWQVMQDIFNRINSEKMQDRIFTVKCSYLEIYNEQIRDLLIPKEQQKQLIIIDDPQKGVIVPDLTEYTVNQINEVLNLIKRGNGLRMTASTSSNQFSSRSHCIVQITLEQRDRAQNIVEEVITSKLALIDLAGSERAAVSENRGLRMQEGANINRSLLALGNCINILSDSRKKGAFVPYRDSKMTRLLKESLGGNTKTIMIACIAPTLNTYEETVNTLKYAQRARTIQKKVTKNVKEVEMHISQYKNIIESLKKEIDCLRGRLREKEGNSEILQNLRQQLLLTAPVPGNVSTAIVSESEMEIISEQIFQNLEDNWEITQSLNELQQLQKINQNQLKLKVNQLKVLQNCCEDLQNQPHLICLTESEIKELQLTMENNEKIYQEIKSNLANNVNDKSNLQKRLRDIALNIAKSKVENNVQQQQLSISQNQSLFIQQQQLPSATQIKQNSSYVQQRPYNNNAIPQVYNNEAYFLEQKSGAIMSGDTINSNSMEEIKNNNKMVELEKEVLKMRKQLEEKDKLLQQHNDLIVKLKRKSAIDEVAPADVISGHNGSNGEPNQSSVLLVKTPTKQNQKIDIVKHFKENNHSCVYSSSGGCCSKKEVINQMTIKNGSVASDIEEKSEVAGSSSSKLQVIKVEAPTQVRDFQIYSIKEICSINDNNKHKLKPQQQQQLKSIYIPCTTATKQSQGEATESSEHEKKSGLGQLAKHQQQSAEIDELQVIKDKKKQQDQKRKTKQQYRTMNISIDELKEYAFKLKNLDLDKVQNRHKKKKGNKPSKQNEDSSTKVTTDSKKGKGDTKERGMPAAINVPYIKSGGTTICAGVGVNQGGIGILAGEGIGQRVGFSNNHIYNDNQSKNVTNTNIYSVNQQQVVGMENVDNNAFSINLNSNCKNPSKNIVGIGNFHISKVSSENEDYHTFTINLNEKVKQLQEINHQEAQQYFNSANGTTTNNNNNNCDIVVAQSTNGCCGTNQAHNIQQFTDIFHNTDDISSIMLNENSMDFSGDDHAINNNYKDSKFPCKIVSEPEEIKMNNQQEHLNAYLVGLQQQQPQLIPNNSTSQQQQQQMQASILNANCSQNVTQCVNQPKVAIHNEHSPRTDRENFYSNKFNLKSLDEAREKLRKFKSNLQKIADKVQKHSLTEGIVQEINQVLEEFKTGKFIICHTDEVLIQQLALAISRFQLDNMNPQQMQQRPRSINSVKDIDANNSSNQNQKENLRNAKQFITPTPNQRKYVCDQPKAANNKKIVQGTFSKITSNYGEAVKALGNANSNKPVGSGAGVGGLSSCSGTLNSSNNNNQRRYTMKVTEPQQSCQNRNFSSSKQKSEQKDHSSNNNGSEQQQQQVGNSYLVIQKQRKSFKQIQSQKQDALRMFTNNLIALYNPDINSDYKDPKEFNKQANEFIISPKN